MTRVTLGLVLLLTGCAPLLTEQRAAKLYTEVRAIHTDFSVLSATFTPEQREKYAHAKAVQDEATFQEFYASLDAQQRATMKGLLGRAHQVEQERQHIVQAIQHDLAMRHDLPRGIGIPISVGGI